MFDELFSIDLIYSGACNMACEYCYIHKDPQNMHDYNAKIRAAIKDGSYQRKIIEAFGDRKEQVGHMGLWGAEPTLNAEYYKPFIYPLFDYFPNLSHVLISTNALLGINAIKQFLDATYEYAVAHDKMKTFEMQFSIDGPPYLNDDSRHPGATENSIKVIKETIQYYLNLVKNDKTHLHINMNVKATINGKWMKYLADNPDKLIEWFDYFDKLQTECSAMVSEGMPVGLALANTPTVVDPGWHTIEDGQVFAKFIDRLSKLDVGRWKNYWHPLYPQMLRAYQVQLNYGKQNILEPGIYACAAGRNTWSIDYKGSVQVCHRCFDNAYMGMSPISRALIPDVSTEGYEGEAKETQLVALDYTNRLFHDLSGTAARHYFLTYLLKALVIAGIYPERVLDPEYIKLMLQYIGGISCHEGQLEDTGSIYLTTLSYVNLLGNGALENLQCYYMLADQLNDQQKEKVNDVFRTKNRVIE